MIKKIISGGQTGADQAALDAAIKYNFPYGGWIPKGRKTEDGILPDKYKLKEMPADSYEKRTEQNVIDSDGTVIISHGKLTGGSKLTQELAEKYDRACFHADMNETSAFIAVSKINSWIIENEIEVLNIAGPRASNDPEIYEDTRRIIEGVILSV
ncbi:MAG: putative molybdenum carrier protein [Thermodesulfobacteriota bacterium]|nr:putative molybdenum carrier protein [Thermodesulfobacteriota bacterium]